MLADRVRMVSSKKRAVPWVMGGQSGKLAVSEDGIAWTLVNSNLTYDIADADHGDGKWIVVDDRGYASISDDGYNWTSIGRIAEGTIRVLAYCGHLWILGGYNGLLMTSSDGINWTARNSGAGNDVIIEDIAYAHDNTSSYKWGAVVSNREEDVMIRSTNGTSWMTVGLGSSYNNYPAIAYGNQKWVIINGGTVYSGSDIYTSGYDYPGGFTRTKDLSSYQMMRDVAYGNGKWMCVGSWRDGTITKPFLLISTDAVNWSIVYFYNTIAHGQRVAYGNGLWLMTGSGGYLATSTNPTTNENSWVTRTSPFGSGIVYCIAYGGE